MISAIVAISRFGEILRQLTQALKWSATMNNSTMTTAPTIFTDCETFAFADHSCPSLINFVVNQRISLINSTSPILS